METLVAKIRLQSTPEIQGQVLTEEETALQSTVRRREMDKHVPYKWFVQEQIQMEVCVGYMSHRLPEELMIREG